MPTDYDLAADLLGEALDEAYITSPAGGGWRGRGDDQAIAFLTRQLIDHDSIDPESALAAFIAARARLDLTRSAELVAKVAGFIDGVRLDPDLAHRAIDA